MAPTTRKWEPPAVTPALLQQMVDDIRRHFPGVERIILFGSRAWGRPRPESDVDLLVVMPSDLRPAQRSAAVARVCRPPFLALDVVVRTPAELAERRRLGDPFIKHVLNDGTLLYEQGTGERVDSQG